MTSFDIVTVFVVLFVLLSITVLCYRSVSMRKAIETSHVKTSTTFRPYGGTRETARRRRQIERGYLTSANGLVSREVK